MSPCIGGDLGSFRHRVSHRLKVRQLQRVLDGSSVYPPLLEEMVEAGLQEMEICVSSHHNTVAQYIVTSTIVDLCLAAKIRPETRVSERWWYKESLYLVDMRKADQEA